MDELYPVYTEIHSNFKEVDIPKNDINILICITYFIMHLKHKYLIFRRSNILTRFCIHLRIYGELVYSIFKSNNLNMFMYLHY